MEKRIIEIINNHKSSNLIYIFGSYVTERYNSESDIDIAVLWDEKIESFELYNIKKDLLDFLENEVDLIELSNANLTLTKEIIYKGKLIYKESEEKKLDFEYRSIVLFNQYVDDIKIIKEKIKERGRIYGGDTFK